MRTKNELYQEALRTVARRRQTARAKAEDARAEAEAAVPGLRHAEEEVRVRGIRCALAGAAGKDRTDAAAALTDARKKLADLLASSGRPADALEPHFTCRLCEDTGIVDGHTCSCVHKVMQQLRRSEIEALSSLSISSFDTMELRYYPARMDASLGEPVRSYMSTLLDDLRGYADEFDTASESLMLLGNAGLGKTHAALAIAGEVLEKASTSSMCPAPTSSRSSRPCTSAPTPPGRKRCSCAPPPGPTCSSSTTWVPSSTPASSSAPFTAC